MYGGSITANNSSGVYNNGGIFTMYGGSITGNTTGSKGGVYNSGTFTMSGGSITGNTATEKGGVYNNNNLTLSGVVTIWNNKVGANNNNLFLTTGKTISMNANVLTGVQGVTGETHIGVTTETLPTDGSSVTIAAVTGDLGSITTCGNRFLSDNQDYETSLNITADTKTVELKKKSNSGGSNPGGGSNTGGSTNTGSGNPNTGSGSGSSGSSSGNSGTTYQILNGANSTWTAGTVKGLTIRGNGEFSKFTGVKVDGNLLDQSNYTAKEGSTIVTLKASYLNSLAAGNHTAEILWNDGSVSTAFTIRTSAANTKDNVPRTGDSSPVAWLLLLAGLSGVGLILTGRKGKKNL